ncbi:ParB family protein [uncultured Porticoccus sp.]|uniref:ParB family protein n=1 Tax=uncultured Porticoccus sp. TaxID=1256050 RepID=UPI00260CC1B5|nr:ParB family protein [uncultured Porticoccus sp.]
MADLTSKDMASKLLADQFRRSGPDAEALSDPIADTPMTVTLEQLLPYDLNPRVTRNPRYEELKESIRKRGLDTPPAITRRPGESHYIIRNGGNTRLAILNELWTETKDETFFRIQCLFRPWPERGEIVALTGHLAENELHGGLTFIERALGIEKARELYEVESGITLTQTELARRLSADGYPITQPHISRMQDAVLYLLPAIPTVLYSGLGRPQIERLTALRKSSERTWEALSMSRGAEMAFASLFHDVLATFDSDAEGFSVRRIQDELIGQMAELLQVDYDTLTLDITESDVRNRLTSAGAALKQRPAADDPAPRSIEQSPGKSQPQPPAPPAGEQGTDTAPTTPKPANVKESPPPERPDSSANDIGSPVLAAPDNERLQAHVVTPATTTDRLQDIQRLLADQTGNTQPDFESTVLQAIPVQAGGLYPITDVWYIEPGLDVSDSLRVHIAQFATEMAHETGQAHHIQPTDTGIGFHCDLQALSVDGHVMPLMGRAVLTLLHALSAGFHSSSPPTGGIDNLRLLDLLGPLLQGRQGTHHDSLSRLSDNGLVKLFRLLRLSRRLVELESGTGTELTPPGGS